MTVELRRVGTLRRARGLWRKSVLSTRAIAPVRAPETFMPKVHEGRFDASGLRVALVVSRFNSFINDRLVEGAVDALVRHGADDAQIEIFKVPGTWELPQLARWVAATGRFDGIVSLGCLIRGSTSHYDVLAAEVTKGLAAVASDSDVPLTFGVLTCDTIEQAIERAGTKAGNKGFDAAMALVELVNVRRLLTAGA